MRFHTPDPDGPPPHDARGEILFLLLLFAVLVGGTLAGVLLLHLVGVHP